MFNKEIDLEIYFIIYYRIICLLKKKVWKSLEIMKIKW